MEDFVPFKLAVKLEEKGFSCEYPFAMYNEYGLFFPLYSSDKYYYGIEDFDKNDYIAPTISQVLNWLRKEKKIHIQFWANACGYIYIVCDTPEEGASDIYNSDYSGPNDGGTWDKYEDCAFAGIEYVLDNLI